MFTVRVSGLAGISSGRGSGWRISGLMRPQDTWAFCTALNSFAAWEDLTANLPKQDKNVVNAAISQAAQPVPATLRAPKVKMNRTPVIEMTPYSGGMAATGSPALAAVRS